ncbi:MAG: ribosome-recycling factor [Metamycoplasmataceae bacterium]
MEYELYEIELIDELKDAINSVEIQLSRVSTAGANPQLINTLKILYYDELTSIGDLSTITIPESQQLLVKPFDKETVKEIFKTIEKQNYQISLINEGNQIRITFPLLTTEKRKEAVKQLSSIKEAGKIKIRNSRHSILKQMKDDKELSEDVLKNFKENVQKTIDKYNAIIDKKINQKEEELMKL